MPRGPAHRHPRDSRLPVWIAVGVAALLAVGGGGIAAGVVLLRDGDDAVATVAESASPTPSPPVSPTPSSSPAPPTITISGVGDVIMGSAPDLLPANGGAAFFQRVSTALRGDLVMGNLETPLTEDTGYVKCVPVAAPTPSGTKSPPPKRKPEGCFAFRMPPSYTAVLKSGGFHVVNLANNHTLDYGDEGLANTRANLDQRGIKHTGAPAQITMMKVKGARVAVLGFSPYSWGASVIDIEAAADLVRQASAQADIVVVNMHAGAEGADKTRVRPGTEIFLDENRGDPIAFARAVVDAGADLVVGHSPHVLRAMEFYKGRLIAYSMGNFAGYQVLSSAGPAGIGGVVQATLRYDGSWVSGRLVPTRMVDGGYPAVDPQKKALQLVRDLSAADFPRSGVQIGQNGAITPRA